jgi:hypothetical protein
MIDKDFVAYIEFGNPENTIHWLKTAYFSKHVNGLIELQRFSQFAFFSLPMRLTYRKRN